MSEPIALHNQPPMPSSPPADQQNACLLHVQEPHPQQAQSDLQYWHPCCGASGYCSPQSCRSCSIESPSLHTMDNDPLGTPALPQDRDCIDIIQSWNHTNPCLHRPCPSSDLLDTSSWHSLAYTTCTSTCIARCSSHTCLGHCTRATRHSGCYWRLDTASAHMLDRDTWGLAHMPHL